MDTQKFPWDRLARVALMMGIGIEQFWELTPGELLRLLAQEYASDTQPFNQAALEQLMAQFPDDVPTKT